jgi:uncharacterized protein
MIIDLHTHPFCKEASTKPSVEESMNRMFANAYDQDAASFTKSVFSEFFTKRSIEDMIRDMDESGISKACIVAMDLTSRYGIELVTNEDVGRLARQYPDRFIPFASVDPAMGRVAVDRLITAVKTHGCKGLKLVPPIQHVNISDPKYDPLWQTALDLNIPVWTHAAHQMSDPNSDASLGRPMLVDPVAHKFPGLKIILGHCGFPWPWETWSMVVRHKNVYADISAYSDLYNHLPWDAYTKYNAEEKLMFATDYPLCSFKETLDALQTVDITADFREKILYRNAIKLLNLE